MSEEKVCNHCGCACHCRDNEENIDQTSVCNNMIQSPVEGEMVECPCPKCVHDG